MIERSIKLSDFKDTIGLQKTNGKKITSLRGIEKLDDANKAGSNESLKCTLILTEGDSAKALAVAGLSVVGRDYFGVFPLRGKVLNVRDIALKKVSDNHEINQLVKIMGLKFGGEKIKQKEDTLKELRYGRIMIFTDADVDGSHIKGLLINLFSIFWPELLEIPGFIISLATPILKVKKQKESIEFYTMTEFNTWKEKIDNLKQWDVKYYKGLGTSTSEEAKGYFTHFENKNICYTLCDEETDLSNKELSIDKIELAFDKKRSEDRKVWLKTYDKDNIIEQSQKKVYYHEFIDRELIHFSDYDCKRSIPCLCDGLKPSFRKILYSCFKRNLKKEIKVAQLAGYVSENSAYHHGEQSLYDSIIGLAQDFVGSNNIELLEPKGQFGCLSPHTKILMWDGSNKRADQIEINDRLVGDDGKQRIVLDITSGIDEMYDIICENGELFTVNSQHYLTLYHKPFKLVIDVKIADYLQLSMDLKSNLFLIRNDRCIEWSTQQIDQDPYMIWKGYHTIPMDYIVNDKEIRLTVLAGYIDQYGSIQETIHNHLRMDHIYIQLDLSSIFLLCPSIISNLAFLCQSLGYITEKKEMYLIINVETLY